ncbi:hypothetical protein ACHWQZ_G005487 [Mnemiopsis leidyi]
MMAKSAEMWSNQETQFHKRYLEHFRVEQCSMFLQHKCSHHRPFTCFYWHFKNQRRRRPALDGDGEFTYSPFTYCTEYDETTGVCPNEDKCLLLHKNAGDTERKYHLRHYKTVICPNETDNSGHCVKNGAHCPFSHTKSDVRQPIYGREEVKNIEEGNTIGKEEIYNTLVNSQGAMEAQKKMQEDIRWADSMFVLVAYKTEPCKRAARLCRQGYACPNYHNNKDRRRSPKIWKYRSTPCPLVKSNDEWGDPSVCEHQDSCGYCHTRTEQQFHPEIYKSTRCKDMQQYLFCPRGPFCAFAHDDDEAQVVYDISDTQYPDTTSPPTSVSGIIGDKRSRSYTHTGLALEARARSGSNDSRIRSLSLIDSLQNMSLAGQQPVPVHSAAPHVPTHPSNALPDNRNRSQSQGSGENANLAPDHRESSPRVAAQVLNEATKAATLAAVQHQQLAGFDSEHNNFYGNTSLPNDISGVNGHYPGHITSGAHPEYNASHANFPAGGEPHNPAEYSMMLNGLINSSSVPDQRRLKAEQAVLIQQHQQQEQQRVLVNDSLETLKAINKLTTSLVFNASKLPVNVLVHIRQQYARTLEELNSMLAVRKQMACIVCVDRPRDALIHPCSHYVSCQECLKTHKYCPACNELIQRIYNVCI